MHSTARTHTTSKEETLNSAAEGTRKGVNYPRQKRIYSLALTANNTDANVCSHPQVVAVCPVNVERQQYLSRFMPFGLFEGYRRSEINFRSSSTHREL